MSKTPAPPEHIYRLRYALEPGRFRKDEADGKGLTDALILCSRLTDPSGALSYMWFSKNGETGIELPPSDVFGAWSMLARQLANDEDIGEEQRAIAATAFEAVRKMILTRRGLPT